MESRRVAIIGAGPSGAIALDSFLNAGYTDITVFERNRVVGGTWNLDEHLGFCEKDPLHGIHDVENIDSPYPVPTEIVVQNGRSLNIKNEYANARFSGSSLYPQVETNVLAELMNFSKKPMPPIHPPNNKERYGVEDAFRHHSVIREYICGFFKGREEFLRLETSVEKAWQPNGLGGKWRLVLRQHKGEDTHWYSEEYDFVYVAVGHFSVPNIPNVKGLRESAQKLPPGVIMHTKTFRDPTAFKNKRVLFVGSGFSNVDIVQLVQKADASLPIHLSLRSVLPVAVSGFAQPWIEAHPTISEVTITSENKLDVTFIDGSFLRDIDNLILGTGYLYSYPFLKEYVGQYKGGIISPNGRRTQNLFWSTWWNFDPSLAIAADITDSVFWRFIEHQSKASAGLWKRSRSEWPNLKECEEWEASRNSKNLKDFHTWWPHFDTLFTALGKWGNYDPGDVSIYLPLFEKGFYLKTQYWKKLSKKWLDDHPEDLKNYEKVLGFLQRHQITQIGF